MEPGLGPGLERLAPGGADALALSRLRALSRDQPVSSHTVSRISPFSFLDALAYASAYLRVISALPAIENSFPIPRQ
jgi:hypothetical protein